MLSSLLITEENTEMSGLDGVPHRDVSQEPVGVTLCSEGGRRYRCHDETILDDPGPSNPMTGNVR